MPPLASLDSSSENINREAMVKVMNPADLSGQRFGRLVVVGFAFSQKGHSHWKCRCDCGTEKVIRASNMRRDRTVSCGCRRREQSKRIASQQYFTNVSERSKHARGSYTTWRSMRRRCTSPTDRNYARYGGRGIRVCERWLASLANFVADMGERPAGKSLDRIDPNGNYEPSNCRWATAKEQSATKRLAIPRVLEILERFESEAPDLIARLRVELFGKA